MARSEPLGNLQQLLMLAVIRLEKDAYAAQIQEELEAQVGRNVTLSTIYITMNRLQQRGWVTSHLSEPTPVRGGKGKRIYQVTDAGREVLGEARRELDLMWRGLEPEAS